MPEGLLHATTDSWKMINVKRKNEVEIIYVKD